MATGSDALELKAEYKSDDQKVLIVSTGNKQSVFTAPEGKFWTDLMITPSNDRFFTVLHKGERNGFSWIEDLYTFSLRDYQESPDNYQLKKIPLKTDLKEAVIFKIFSSNYDGTRILTELHYNNEKIGNMKFFTTYPYFMNTADGTIEAVKP